MNKKNFFLASILAANLANVSAHEISRTEIIPASKNLFEHINKFWDSIEVSENETKHMMDYHFKPPFPSNRYNIIYTDLNNDGFSLDDTIEITNYRNPSKNIKFAIGESPFLFPNEKEAEILGNLYEDFLVNYSNFEK